MKAFIVGITGFVGSHLAERLLEQDVRVIGCSRSAKWGRGGLTALAAEIPVFSWDLAKPFPPGALEQLKEFAPDWVFHLGAISIPAQCGADDPTPEALAVNVQGTENLCQVALSLPNRPRLLLTSSCHVYAPVDARDPYVDEKAPIGPTRAYGKTKLEAERRVLDAVRDGLDGIVARAFHHTGPRQSERMVLPDWARQFVKDDREPIRVGSMDAFLDLSDVRDVVRAYQLLVEQGKSGEIYNVGSGVCRRSGDIFQQLRALADPDREFAELSPGRRQEPIADAAKLRKATGWKPRIPFEQTLTDTLEYWRRNDTVG